MAAAARPASLLKDDGVSQRRERVAHARPLRQRAGTLDEMRHRRIGDGQARRGSSVTPYCGCETSAVVDLNGLLKLVHVFAAIVAVGANVTYAFWLALAGQDRAKLVFAINGIRRLDSRVANPAYVVLALTGVPLVIVGRWSFTAPGSGCRSSSTWPLPSSASPSTRRPSASSSGQPRRTQLRGLRRRSSAEQRVRACDARLVSVIVG
jgi:hypothetical protein